jgi:hypothetical protein
MAQELRAGPPASRLDGSTVHTRSCRALTQVLSERASALPVPMHAQIIFRGAAACPLHLGHSRPIPRIRPVKVLRSTSDSGRKGLVPARVKLGDDACFRAGIINQGGNPDLLSLPNQSPVRWGCILLHCRSSASDAVDGSSTGTRVPWMWGPLKLP